ncbi:glycosyltransferase family 2 protein [Thiocapsa bogorovii]|uniref:glycosyltransferase family 2 protein n=1 Tax=Thiocapsa bogorovii TaxID=521689 RepID=UPI001E59B5B6|nr:glycosyltransferase family 2 protein [Thiocapsa bogorovii]UHD16249.1 glycosyltransferase [Thiocapsa bogorovii]
MTTLSLQNSRYNQRKVSGPDVSVVLLTYRRPATLEKCLLQLLKQVTVLTFEIVVVDNDEFASGRGIVEKAMEESASAEVRLEYQIVPEQNISLARNAGITKSSGDIVAFIDDDESPSEMWLQLMYDALKRLDADGVFGPVLASFPDGYPDWLKESRVFSRRRMKTGACLGKTPEACKTGNALIYKHVLKSRPGPFDAAYGRTGGEDSELFHWLTQQGRTFYWCDDAVVYEIQGKERMELSWHMSRGYRGGWAHAKKIRAAHGMTIGGSYLVLSAGFSSLKILLEALNEYRNPRGAVMFLLRGWASQAGKIGFLLGWKIEGY